MGTLIFLFISTVIEKRSSCPKKKIADIISYLFSPVTNACYVLLLISILHPMTISLSQFILDLIIAFFFLCIMPVIGILVYVKKGVVDIWVSDQNLRTPFYMVAILGYLIAIIFFSFRKNPDFYVLSLAYLFVTLTITILNLKTKMSSHTAGLTGPFTAAVFLFGFPALSLFLILPLIIWARLELNAHTHFQLIGGSLIGCIVTYATYAFFY